MSCRMRARALLAWLMGGALTVSACSGGGTSGPAATTPPAQTSASSAGEQAVAIDFRTEPDPVKTGQNQVEVTVREPNGTPVTDATVKTVFSMPAMPSMNMPAMRSEAPLTHEEGGRYRGTGELSMAGTWNVTVTVSRGSTELGSKSFSVIAK